MYYRHGLIATESGHFNIVAHPVTGLRYVLAYLGAPLGGWLGNRGSSLAGLAVIAALAAFLASDLRSPFRMRRLVRNAVWYALAVYPLLCAIGTSTGRAGFGIDQALSSRYTTIGILTWIAVIGLAAGRLGRLPPTAVAKRSEMILVAAVAFGFVIGASEVTSWSNWSASANNLLVAREGLIHNDPAALGKIYPDREHVVMLMGELRAIHDNIYAAP
jgi:hypothetical protein